MQKMFEARLNKSEPVTVVCRRSCGIHETKLADAPRNALKPIVLGSLALVMSTLAAWATPVFGSVIPTKTGLNSAPLELTGAWSQISVSRLVQLTSRSYCINCYFENKLKTATKEYSRAKTRAVEHIPYDGYQLEYISAYQKRDESSQVSR